MEWIPIFLGILIALAFYLHFVTKMNEKADHNEKLDQADVELENEADNNGNKTEEKPKGLKQRICPLCGSQLEKHQSLYAEMYEGTHRPKVIIHGCRFCYKPSGHKAKSNIDESQYIASENKM